MVTMRLVLYEAVLVLVLFANLAAAFVPSSLPHLSSPVLRQGMHVRSFRILPHTRFSMCTSEDVAPSTRAQPHKPHGIMSKVTYKLGLVLSVAIAAVFAGSSTRAANAAHSVVTRHDAVAAKVLETPPAQEVAMKTRKGRLAMMSPSALLAGPRQVISVIDERGIAGGLVDAVKGRFSGYNEVVMYKASQVLAAPILIKLMVLVAVSSVLVGIGGAALVLFGEHSWSDGLFKAYSLLNNVPGISGVDEPNLVRSFIVNSIFIVGMMTFAVALGVVTSSISVALENILEGNHKVVERGHMLVLNWNDKTVPMLRQADEAMKDGSLRNRAVVILANKPRSDMAALLESELEGTNIQVLVREGNPSSLNDLQRVSAGEAQHVLILSPENVEDDSEQLKEMLTTQAACVRSLQHQRQLGKTVKPRKSDLKVVVNAPADIEESTLMGFKVCHEGMFVQRVLAMSTSLPGVSKVHSEILNQGSGCEIYVHKASTWPWLKGKKFQELGGHFPSAVVMGWIANDEVELNPSPETIIPEHARLVLLGSENVMKCRRTPMRTWIPTADEGKKVRITLDRPAQKILVLNNENDNSVLEYLGRTAPRGSKITVLAKDKSQISVPSGGNAKFNIIQGSSLDYQDVESLHVETYDSVLVQSAAAGETELGNDAKVLAQINILLDLRKEASKRKPLKDLHLVASIKSRTSIDTLNSLTESDSGVEADWILSTELESGAVMQVLWQPHLNTIYQELLDSDGGEIFLVAAEKIVGAGSHTFSEISTAALSKKAVALGVMHADGKLELSPHKKHEFKLGEGDRVVLFADAF